jgi:hypothetical protein
MKLNIVVEGATDARIIRAILGPQLSSDIRLYASQGKMSLVTVGRNILVHEGGKVLIAFDSATQNRQAAAEQESMTEIATSGFLSASVQDPTLGGRIRAFAFLPEIEVVLFEAPQVFDSFLTAPLSSDCLADAKRHPKESLTEKNGLTLDYSQFLAKTTVPPLSEILATGEQATAFRKLVQSMLADS